VAKCEILPRTWVFLRIELNPKIQVYIIWTGSSRQIQWWGLASNRWQLTAKIRFYSGLYLKWGWGWASHWLTSRLKQLYTLIHDPHALPCPFQ
jgi:hypothetical protein